MKKAIISLTAVLLLGATGIAFAQGTAFTYQGRLNDGANVASDNYDLTFSLWNASSGPSQIGGTITNAATAISNGLFTVTLDFGNQFPGAGRWLEIGVRTNGGGAFATLSPRQALTSTPYAIQAGNAATATSAGSVAAANITGTIPLANLPTIVVTNGASSVNISGTFAGNGGGLTNVPGAFPQQLVAGTNLPAQVNQVYNLTNSALVTVTLPTNANVGDLIQINGLGLGGWQVQVEGSPIDPPGANWTPRAVNTNWASVAVSANGTKMVAAAGVYFGSGRIYTSSDRGITWFAASNAPVANWRSVACSADGTKMVAANRYQVYTSADGGNTWALRVDVTPFCTNWTAVAASADGSRLVAAARCDGVSSLTGSAIYYSSDYGVTWTRRTNAPLSGWSCVASSASGDRLIAAAGGTTAWGANTGPIWVSTDQGLTWSAHGPTNVWSSIASSSDGTKLCAGRQYSGIHTSDDGGNTWTERTNAPANGWSSVACSSDGIKLVAAGGFNGRIYTSINSGLTWAANGPTNSWTAVASSSAGTTLVATPSAEQIYTFFGGTPLLTGSQGTSTELRYAGNGEWEPVRLPDSTGAIPNTLVSRDNNGNFSAGTVTAGNFIGSGAGLFELNASQLTSGTLADARLSANVSLLGASIESAEITDGTIVNADINGGAAVAYSKLNLTNGIVNADINGGAAIAYSKLNLTAGIVNADINAAAAIADTKLATISTAGKVANTALSSNVSLLGASIESAEITDGAVTSPKLGTVTPAQLQTTITDPPTPANFSAAHQFGYAMSTAGVGRFVVGDPFWDQHHCFDPPFCAFWVPDVVDAGRICIYNTNGSLIASVNLPGITANAQLGYAVADAGGYLLVGAPGGALDVPKVYSITYNGAITNTRTGPSSVGFGRSVAGLANGLVLVGSPFTNSNVGAVSVYTAGSGVPGGQINPPGSGEFGATMVSVGGNKVLIGAPLSAFGRGVVHLYDVPTVSSAFQITSITNPVGVSGGFGRALAMLGSDRVIIGAPGNPGGGAAYLYGTNGALLATFAHPEPSLGGSFGSSVAAFGADKILLSASEADDSGVVDSGVVYVFNTNGAWIGVCRNPSPVAGAKFGTALLPMGTDRIAASAFDLPNAGARGSVRFFSLDGPHYIPGLSVEPGLITTDSLADGAVTAAKIGGVLNPAQIPNLDAAKVTSGTLADARLSANVPLLSGGKLSDSVLSANVALRSVGNTFSGNQIINGNVGISNSTPAFPLSFSNDLGDKISLWGGLGNHYGFGIQGNRLQVHVDSGSSDIVFGHGQSTNLTELMRIRGDGNVGIGINPTAKLQVVGDVKLGSSGQYFAPGGEENLRIVRGGVTSAGTIINGTGFTAARNSLGHYTITFTAGFNSNPTITVSCGAAGQTLASLDSASVGSVSTTSFTVETGTRNAGWFDEPFSFIAIGPR